MIGAAFGEGLIPQAEKIIDSVAFQLPAPIMELEQSGRDEYLHAMAVISVFMGNRAPYEYHGCTWLVTNDKVEAGAWEPPHNCVDCRTAIATCINLLQEDGSVWVALGRTEYTVYHPPAIVVADVRGAGVVRLP